MECKEATQSIVIKNKPIHLSDSNTMSNADITVRYLLGDKYFTETYPLYFTSINITFYGFKLPTVTLAGLCYLHSDYQ